MFLKEFKEQWSESRFVANLSEGKAVALYFQMMLDPLYFCSIVGFLMLGSNERWFGILQVTVEEFFQFNGTKLSLYAIFLVGTICLILHKYAYVQKFGVAILASVSQVVFAACSIISGVFIGLTIPAFLFSLDLAYLYVGIIIPVFLGIIAAFSYFSVRVPKYLSRHDFTKPISIVMVFFGVGIFIYAVYGVFWGGSVDNSSTYNTTITLTNCLRVIRNAWHFYYALVLVFKVVCGSFGIALLTP